ncbi:succinate dehydrogenase, cytochrome b556 subunit [Parasphingopyxis algicola]|uniref:succinate dehydrogenase, cytochrome b556 subunit n=1 Tax=Parasphingopyxis algicola TaxID=2026624 RepID=UPI0015A0DD8C|nr:succinate dehydrogenase, cytochrome b556 subunit [Parasphingopyxis algicola]QLC25134.1 succinate dehydrogenase, cytochrome b556 subunit [Parasphingopyxis algicola]
MSSNQSRPLSPHLMHWKWGPHMLVSILHRITGVGLAIVGGLLFAGWLLAAASGEATYAWFMDLLTVESGAINIVGAIFGIGLTWAFFTHLFNGLRHFVLDTGAGYELQTNRRWSITVVAGAIVATILLWGWLLWPALVALTAGEG